MNKSAMNKHGKHQPKIPQPPKALQSKNRQIEITINEEKRTLNVREDQTLLELLRNDMGLTGAKNGCGKGFCGTCTVILDGKAVRSCRMQAVSAHGAIVETIENLADADSIHVIQYAFIIEGAVQCGFCTPGMIMSVKALLDHNPNPSEADVSKTLNPHLCRCTGYQSIRKAVILAARLIQQGKSRIARKEVPIGMPNTPNTQQISEGNHAVGLELRDKSILEKVTGTLVYADDSSESALYGKIVFSKFPSAVFTIDTEKAAAVPGVVIILTGKDVPGVNALGMLILDQPALADGVVKCTADPVAVVIAESAEISQAAADLITVSYTPLPAHYTPADALAEGAYPIHTAGNICHQAQLQRGDVEAAFRTAAVVVEQSYTTQVVDPGFLESESGMAWMDKQGRIVVEMGTQSAFDDRRQIAAALGVEESGVVIRQLPMGGAFGAKEDISLQFILALAVWKTSRRVRITLTREESFLIHPKRHPAIMNYKTAMDAAGNLIAVQIDITADTGAYASLGPDILENMLTFGAGPYEVPNLDIKGRLVYTNNPPSGAIRGFGVPQVAFGMEQQMARMADLLGIDPLVLRLQNALRPGRQLASGQVMEEGTAAVETMEALRDSLIGFEKPANTDVWQYGMGVASAMKNVGFGHGVKETAGAVLEIGDTSVQVWCGTYEYGQGSLIALKQLTSEALGVDFGSIILGLTETTMSPETGATTASRQTFLSGNAVLGAAYKLKEQIFAAAEAYVQSIEKSHEGEKSQAVYQTLTDTLSSGNPAADSSADSTADWVIFGSWVKNHRLGQDLDLFAPPFIGLRSNFRYQAPDTSGFGADTEPKTHWSYIPSSAPSCNMLAVSGPVQA